MSTRIQPVLPPGWTAPAGHYSPGVVCGDLIFVSGQLPPLNLDGHADPSFDAQVRTCLHQMLAVVHAAGGAPETIVKVTAYIVGVEHWGRFNAVYAEVMGAARPARAVIPVPELHHGCLVEIEAVAARLG